MYRQLLSFWRNRCYASRKKKIKHHSVGNLQQCHLRNQAKTGRSNTGTAAIIMIITHTF